MLLIHEELPANANNNFLSARSSGCTELQSPLVLNGAWEEPKRSVEAFEELPRENKHAHLFQRECGSQSENFRKIDLSPTPHSQIDPAQKICEGADSRKCDRTLFSFSLDDTGTQGRIGWSGDDPVLSALLRRFGEIKAEIERRHSTIRK